MMSQMEKILNVLCGSYRFLCERRLLRAWKKGVSYESNGEQARVLFGDVDSDETLKEHLFSGFLGFVGERCGQFEKLPRIARYDECLPPDELEVALSNIVNDLIDEYINKGIKETLRSDPNTFNGLYRSVQRFARDYLGDRLYGAHSQYAGREGMNETAFSEAVADAVSQYDERLIAIPLPNDVTYSACDFYEKSGRRRYTGKPFMKLLSYYIDAVESSGLGRVVQLRTFVTWVNARYNLLPVIVSQSLTAADSESEEEYPRPLESIGDEALNAEVRTICKDSAREIFHRMRNRERSVFLAIYDGDSAADWQQALGLQTEQQAYAAQRKLVGFLRSNIEALPDLSACGEEAQDFFLQELFDLCKKAPARRETCKAPD